MQSNAPSSTSSLSPSMQPNSPAGLGMQHAAQGMLPPDAFYGQAPLQAAATTTGPVTAATNVAAAATAPAMGYPNQHQIQQHTAAVSNPWQQSQRFSSSSSSDSAGYASSAQQQLLQDGPHSSYPQLPSPHHNSTMPAGPSNIPTAPDSFLSSSQTILGMPSMPHPYQHTQLHLQPQQQAAAGTGSPFPASTAAAATAYPLSPSLHVQLLGSPAGSCSSNLEALLPEVASPPSTPGSLAGTADVQQYWLHLQQQQQQQQAAAAASAVASTPGAAPRYTPSPLGLAANQWQHGSSSGSGGQPPVASDGSRSISSGGAPPSVAAAFPASNHSATGYHTATGMQHPQIPQQQSSCTAPSQAASEYATPRGAFDGPSSGSAAAAAVTHDTATADHALPVPSGTEELLHQAMLRMLGQQQQQQQSFLAAADPQHALGAYAGSAAHGVPSPRPQRQGTMQGMTLHPCIQQLHHVHHQQHNVHQPQHQQQQQQPAIKELAQQLLAALAANGPSGSSNSSSFPAGSNMAAPGQQALPHTQQQHQQQLYQQYNQQHQQPQLPPQQPQQQQQLYQQYNPQYQQPQLLPQQPQQQQLYHLHPQQQLGSPSPATAADPTATPFAHYSAGASTTQPAPALQQAYNLQGQAMWGQAHGMPWSQQTGPAAGQLHPATNHHAPPPHAQQQYSQQAQQQQQEQQQQQQQQQQQPQGGCTSGTAQLGAELNQQLMLPGPLAVAADNPTTAMVAAEQQWPQQQDASSISALASTFHHNQQPTAVAAAPGASLLAPGGFPASMLAPPGPHTAALGPSMAAAAAAAAMAAPQPAMMVPYHPGVFMMAQSAMQPEFMQAAAAAAQQQAQGMGMHMACGMYPAMPVPMHMPMHMQMPAAASMQYWQALQRQYFEAAAAAQGSAGASVSTVPPTEAGDMSRQSTRVPSPAPAGATAGSAEAPALQETAAAGFGNSTFSQALQRLSSAGIVAASPPATAAGGGIAGLLPRQFAAAAWPLSAAEAAMAWMLGRSFMAAADAAQQQPDTNAHSTDHQLDVKSTGLSGLGLSVISAPVAVLKSAQKAAASGLGLLTHSKAAAVRLYVMALVWFAHYQLVLLLYTLLGASAAALATQQLAWGTGRAALAISWQMGVFAMRQGQLFAGAAARVVASDLRQLPQQVLLSHPLLAAQRLALAAGSDSQLLLAAPAADSAAAGAAAASGAAAVAAAAVATAEHQQPEQSHDTWAGAWGWARSALALITGTAVSKPAADDGDKPTTAAAAGGATAWLGSSDTLATQQQQQQQQGVVARRGSSTGLLQAQANLSGQQQQQGGSSLAVADSLSVISGLWVGWGLKLWLLLSVQGPFTAGRIWLDAAGQGVSLSIAAVKAAAAYVLHAVRLLVQCSALLLAHSRLQLPAATASALAAACSAGLYAADLARQVIGMWWTTVGTSAVAAVQALLQSAAQAVPGGAVLLQLLGSAAAAATYAVQATAAAMHRMWRYYAAADEDDWSGFSIHTIAGQVLAWAASGAGWMALRALSAAERVAVLITARVLQGAHPMAQAAVYGSAGMLKRLVVEASQQSWLLLVQLYQAWQQQQQQQQQQ